MALGTLGTSATTSLTSINGWTAMSAIADIGGIASRIKDAILGMNTFIEEFIARIAEAYPSND